MGPEEGEDPADDVIEFADPIDHQEFVSNVRPGVGLDLPTTQASLDQFEGVHTGCPLADRELHLNLAPQPHLRVAVDRDGEATFPVNEPHDPAVDLNHGLSC
jgi:hypothetical protein